MWKYNGSERPPFADRPATGQESVWDYPRPPAIMTDSRRIRVMLAGHVIADTCAGLRVLETASPPTFYLPLVDVDTAALVPAPGRSLCEWKGAASYFDVSYGEQRVARAAWSYLAPAPEFAAIAGHLAFYPALLACFVDDERVRPQPGGFYGGWLTKEIVGPVKGEPGSSAW